MLERSRLIHHIFFSRRETALAVMTVILLCKVVFEFAANLERNNSGENEKTVQGRSNLGFAHRPLSTSHDPNACMLQIFVRYCTCIINSHAHKNNNNNHPAAQKKCCIIRKELKYSQIKARSALNRAA
jgi:hypothetical protein